MNAHAFFRLSLSEARRRLKGSTLFNHRDFCVAELHDPLEPSVPFIEQTLIGALEKAWCFNRHAVPPHIKLFGPGRAARRRALAKLEQEYRLDPVDRFYRIEGSIKCALYRPDDPSTWNTPFFTVIVPAELQKDAPLPILWAGNRAAALTHPSVRKWFLDPQSEVYHGQEALRFARQQWSKMESDPR